MIDRNCIGLISLEKNGNSAGYFEGADNAYKSGKLPAGLGFRQVEETHIMENIIYSELRMRGYAVDVGIVESRERDGNGSMLRKQYEVDFVANLGSNRYYLQSAFSIPNEEKRKQEKASLIKIDDSFKKIILVKDVMNVSRDYDGITSMSVYDFLLNQDSLGVDVIS